MRFYNSHQIEITIQDTPLGQGGQGNVYEIISPNHLKDHVVKIYHPKERSQKRELKINYMIQNPPVLKDNLALIWPEDTLYCNQEFVGFIMPKALGEVDLTSLSVLSESKKLDEFWKSRFSRNTEQGMIHRADICKNIAEAVSKLHQTNQYVLVDIKPENIKVGVNGQVSLIDLDSIEIIHQNELLFSADKLSTEYSPAEIQTLNLQQDIIPVYWDSFSLAVVFYKVLFGLHPFTGTPGKPYESYVTQEQKIKSGLLPVGKKSRLFKIIPTPHQNFKAISKELQALFLRALDEQGLNNPIGRPTASEWAEKLVNFRFNRKKYQIPASQMKIQRRKQQKVKYTSALEYLQRRKDKGHNLLSVLSLIMVGVLVWFSITFDKYFFPKDPAPFHQVMSGHYHNFDGEGPFLVIKKNKYGYINREREVVIDFQFDDAGPFEEGLARVEKDFKEGYINAAGREIVPLIYDRVYEFKDGLARVRLGDKEGFVNRRGEIKIPLIYEKVHDFVNGRAGAVLNDKIGVIDLEGKVIIPIDYHKIIEQGNGIYKVSRGGMIGFVDHSGFLITPLVYSRARDYHEGLVAVALPQRGWGYIDTQGRVIISFGYMDAYSFSEGLAKVETLHGCGFINKYGRNVIPWQYEMVESFSEGLAAVKTNNKWGFVDKAGDMIIPAVYDKVFGGVFNAGRIKVLQNGHVFFIDKQGNCRSNCP